MDWSRPVTPRYYEGDERTVTRFLWLPKCVGGKCRWLEKATWKQEFTGTYYLGPGCKPTFAGSRIDSRNWKDIEWVDVDGL